MEQIKKLFETFWNFFSQFYIIENQKHFNQKPAYAKNLLDKCVDYSTVVFW